MLQARFEEDAGALVVTPLVRDLDAEVAPELRRLLADRAGGRACVVLSLVHVRRIDCSALAVLVAVLKRMPPGSELRVVGATGSVRALIAATHLDELFPLFDDRAAALST
jgi:anti-anti-sigma factor